MSSVSPTVYCRLAGMTFTEIAVSSGTAAATATAALLAEAVRPPLVLVTTQ